ncbi:hypothetical protein [Thiohalophilus sp.]|uniref:ATP-binding protein n=1 Tax=Thiohalophilus sp. TaxID=3028392 RepID=UPI002ACE22FA|nr:hypothetical protein [Thiohalophilus sp.]MDZ7661046.1 hypothetical protein [Thiohalophilus sp.]
MSLDILNTVKVWLNQQYIDCLGVTISESDNTDEKQPRWVIRNSDGRDNAMLLDYEIGNMLNIHVVNNKDDLHLAIDSDIQNGLEWVTKLQPKYGLEKHEYDENGVWQVGMLWLVSSDLSESWKEYIAELRSESGFTEEMSLDVLFYENQDSLVNTLNKFSLPSLLFNTRKLYRLESDKIPQWLTANDAVMSMLENFPERFSDPEVSTRAKRVVDDARNYELGGVTDEFPNEVKTISSLKIYNCRNLTSCELNLLTEKPIGYAKPHVIFGPNGTGKSTLFEALSFSISGTSSRHIKYLEDPDIKKGSDYISQVLAPLDGGNPKIILNDIESLLDAIPYEKTEAESRLRKADGNLLGQEDSINFVRKNSNELGVQILSGYSSLAEYVRNLVELEYEQSNSKRQNWLRGYGLSSNITRQETRLQKLVEYVINENLPQASKNLSEWIKKSSQFFSTDFEKGRTLNNELETHDSKTQRDRLVNNIASFAITNNNNIQILLNEWLESRNNIYIRVNEYIEDISPLVDDLRESLPLIEDELDQWGGWLTRRETQDLDEEPSNEYINALTENIEKLRKESEELITAGKSIRRHYDHIEYIRNDFIPTWANEKPNECPTCSTDHEDNGGIVSVVDKLHAAVQSDLDNKRQELNNKNKELKEAEQELSSFGQCPISEDRRISLGEKLHGLVGDTTLQSILIDEEKRVELKSDLRNLASKPESLHIVDNIDDISSKLASTILNLNAEGERVWSEPDKWKEINVALREESQRIVEQHLPSTLEAVWLELVLSLTSARWNIAGMPKFEASTSRGREKLTVKAGNENKKILARYLYNQAEQHILGLAWFFTRYLTDGRFRNALIALDDPAQEMDQTTFRTFSRFISSFIRLHNNNKTDLSLILFLHQEDRALDMARATNAPLHVLSWEQNLGGDKKDKSALKQYHLLGDGFKPTAPILD